VSVGYLGTKAGEKRVLFRELPFWAYSPVDAVVRRITSTAFAVLVLVAVLVAPLALLAAIAWARPSSADVGVSLLLAMLLSGTVLYALLTTAFGDGLSEAARHFLPGSLAMCAGAIAVAIGLPFLPLRWVSGTLKQGAMEGFVAIAAVAIVVVACMTALAWSVAEPLAIGFVDQPSGRQVSSDGLEVRGWALDPSGVESVQVQLGKISKSARYGEPKEGLPEIHAGYPDARAGGFRLELTRDDLAQAGAPGDLPMRVVVKGRGGTATEIDARTVTFK
jgi:hypothetical protein